MELLYNNVKQTSSSGIYQNGSNIINITYPAVKALYAIMTLLISLGELEFILLDNSVYNS